MRKNVSAVKFLWVEIGTTLKDAISNAGEVSDLEKCTVLFLWNGELVVIPYGHSVSEQDIMSRIVRKNAVICSE